MKLEKVILKKIAKSAEIAIDVAMGSKSTGIFFEAEMPTSLKERKLQKNK